MPILCYEDLSYSDLSALAREKTAVFIPTGPLEEHGPHLPLGTDAFSARYFCEQMANVLNNKLPEWSFVIFPTVFAGSDTLTYTGTIEVKPWVLRALLYDCCKQLAKDGFKTLIAVGTHGGPRHMVVLEEVANKIRWRYRARMISASSRILTEILEGKLVDKISKYLESVGTSLTSQEREALKQDYHGGLLETSLMMLVKPELVKPVYKELNPNIVKSYWSLRRNSAKKVGDGLGHLGYPALARREIGEALVGVLLEGISPLMERFLNGEKVDRFFRSKFYYIPFFRTDFKLFLVIVLYCLLFGLGVLILNHYLMELYR